MLPPAIGPQSVPPGPKDTVLIDQARGGVGPKGNLELTAEDEVLKSQVSPGPEQ